MKGDLKTHSGGVFILGVHNLDGDFSGWRPTFYSCTSVEYSMGMNDLPSLNLVVGQGSPLSGSSQTATNSDGSLQELLDQGISRRADASKLLRCTLYEAANDGTSKAAVFRGYIVNVTALIKTGNLTIKAVRVLCLGLGAVLHISPLAGYRRTSASVFINAASGGGSELPTRGATGVGYVDPFVLQDATSDDFLCANYTDKMKGRDILTKISVLMNVIAEAGTYQGSESWPLPSDDWTEDKLGIKSCLFCNYVLDNSTFPNPNTEKSLNKFLCDEILSNLQQTSVLTTIMSLTNSMDLLMCVVPHFVYGGTADDFRMELRPPDSWNAVNIIEIPDHFVTSCNTALNHLAHLNDPEVLVVDYSDGPGSTDGSNSSGQATGCFGIFALSPVVREWARRRYTFSSDNTVIKEALRPMYYKTRFFRAPSWLDFSHMEDVYDAAVFKTPASIPANDNEAKGGFVTIDQDNLERKTQIADDIAQAMYVYLHGASDTASFALTPDARFGLSSIGCLENHIGRTVDICGYRGILRHIHFVYNSGNTTSASYTITLERVRPIDPSEKHITCTLYRQTQTNTESTGNNALWADGSGSFFGSQAQSAVKNLLGAEYMSSKLQNVAQRVYQVLHN